jgi:hypothetical protein
MGPVDSGSYWLVATLRMGETRWLVSMYTYFGAPFPRKEFVQQCLKLGTVYIFPNHELDHLISVGRGLRRLLRIRHGNRPGRSLWRQLRRSLACQLGELHRGFLERYRCRLGTAMMSSFYYLEARQPRLENQKIWSQSRIQPLRQTEAMLGSFRNRWGGRPNIITCEGPDSPSTKRTRPRKVAMQLPSDFAFGVWPTE